MSAHELDHLAIAVPAWAPAGTVLHLELGARWASGFATPAFNPCQLTVADDMRLELLEPGGAGHSFIQRFLDESDGAAAAHHITFKVHDIRAAIAGAQAAGIEPILVNLEHPAWQEAFLHPRDTGLGFLAQMVQTAESIEDLADGLPNSVGGCPWDEHDAAPVRLQAIHGFVADLQRARHVLVGVLGAREFAPCGADAQVTADPAPAGQMLGFHWDEGADLLLTETGRPGSGHDDGAHPGTATPGGSGIDAIGILPADESWPPGGYPADLAARLRDGAPQPELGIRIAALRAAPVPTAP